MEVVAVETNEQFLSFCLACVLVLACEMLFIYVLDRSTRP